MESAKVYADGFTSSFVKEGDFLEFLKARETNSWWGTKKSKKIRFIALEEDSKLTAELKEKYAEDGNEGIIDDTLENTRLLLKAEEMAYPVRNCAIKTILSRARISGNALNKVEKPVLAKILNYCLRVASGDALLRFSEGKISAVHGGDGSDYAVLEIPELFSRTINYLDKNFPGSTFAGGSYDHSLVTALWELTNQDELVETYKEALSEHGINLDEIKPALRLSSSDVGVSGANLYPMLFVGKNHNIITLGSPLKLEHEAGATGATLEKFDEQLSLIYSRYTKAIKNLTDLLKIEISYPINCMAGVMKRVGISKKLSFEAIDLFKAQNGEGPCTAHDIYYGISEVIFMLQCDGADGSKVAQMEENVARALSVRWGDYDIPGELKW